MLNTSTPQFRMNLLIDLQKVNNAIDFLADIKGIKSDNEENRLIGMHLRLRSDTFRRHAMALVDGKLSLHMQEVTLRQLRDTAVQIYQMVYKVQEILETDSEVNADENTLANINAHRFAIGCIAKHYS